MNNYYQVDRDVAIPSNGTCAHIRPIFPHAQFNCKYIEFIRIMQTFLDKKNKKCFHKACESHKPCEKRGKTGNNRQITQNSPLLIGQKDLS